MDTVEIIADVERWLAQSAGDCLAKQRVFLDRIRTAASAASRRRHDDWRVQGRTARALWAAGRYRLAIAGFDHALALLMELPAGFDALSADDRALAWDVLAARAECWTYLGFPQEAIEDLSLIPAGERRPWYDWTRAFALHQMGFAERVAFAADAGVPVHAPGAELWYLESNRLIDRVKPRLPAAQQFDIELLRAANLGAVCRRRRMDGGDWAIVERRARTALASFTKAPAPSSNATWSWRKERRGRFPTIALPTDPVRNDMAVVAWRIAYREHYHMNLKEAGLPEISRMAPSDDGEIDLVENHLDDHLD